MKNKKAPKAIIKTCPSCKLHKGMSASGVCFDCAERGYFTCKGCGVLSIGNPSACGACGEKSPRVPHFRRIPDLLDALRVYCDGVASKNTYCETHARDLAYKTRSFFPESIVEVKYHGKAAQPCCICGRGGAK